MPASRVSYHKGAYFGHQRVQCNILQYATSPTCTHKSSNCSRCSSQSLCVVSVAVAAAIALPNTAGVDVVITMATAVMATAMAAE